MGVLSGTVGLFITPQNHQSFRESANQFKGTFFQIFVLTIHGKNNPYIRRSKLNFFCPGGHQTPGKNFRLLLEYFPEFKTELKKIIYSMYEKTRGQKSHATVHLIEWHRKPVLERI
jgi:hypothetical protein